MSNVEKLCKEEGGAKIFGETVLSLSNSQGYYCRLCEHINNLDDAEYAQFVNNLNEHAFEDAVDVVLFLEG